MKRHNFILLAASVAFSIFHFPFSTFADSSVWNAVEQGHLTWSNATTNWLANGDLVITYKTGNGSLHLPGFAKVWALAVGGGGAGGAGFDWNESEVGGAGGGGAGGFVENDSLLIEGGEGSRGDFKIAVGAGAPLNANPHDGTHVKGGSGGSSSFLFADNTPVIAVAVGGGGGGAESKGQDGGSGGGGSERYLMGARSQDGGKGTTGQGFAGGKGAVDYVGGGGGGASEVGQDAVATGAKGGDGKASEITGVSVTYAGGGGGGLNDTLAGYAAGLGGAGGGGAGGDGVNAATPGTDGLGGGGGGCGKNGNGAKGGDGVVIVRISWVSDGPIQPPVISDFVYDGNEKTAATDIDGVWTVSQDVTKTDVGNYTLKLTLAAGLTWADGSSDPKTVPWKIVPAHVAVPEPLCDGVVYDEANHIATTNSAIYKFVGVESGNNQTNATNAGDYYFELELNDTHNWRWADESITNQVVNWSILPRPLTPPALPQGLVYAGTNAVAATNSPYYSFTEGSVTVAMNPGTYAFGVHLLHNETVTNVIWSDDLTITNKYFTWSISERYNPFPLPTADGIAFGGTNAIGVASSPWFDFASGSVTSAANVGTYSYTAHISMPYTHWEDGSDADKTYSWTIVPFRVLPPQTTTVFLSRSKAGQSAVVGADAQGRCYTNVIPGIAYCTVTGDKSKSSVGTYTATATVSTPNFAWADGTTGVKSLSYRVVTVITNDCGIIHMTERYNPPHPLD